MLKKARKCGAERTVPRLFFYLDVKPSVAKWYEKRYRKMFEGFAAGNAGRNAVERVGESGDEISFALMNKNNSLDKRIFCLYNNIAK